MAAEPKDPKKAQPQPEKKKTETVLLSGEELRRLSGGSNPANSGSQAKTDGIVKKG